MEIAGKKFNFLGDSITEGVGVSRPENKYVDVFSRKYSPAVARNYGISGTRFARQKSPTVDNPSFDKDFCSRIDEMDMDADFVIVFGGINDFGHGDAPFGSFEDRSADTFFGACHTLMSTLLKKYPRAIVAFMTPLHSAPDERVGKPHLATYAEAIRKTAAYYNIPLLDLYDGSEIQPTDPESRERYIPDGVHPNDEGAAIIARALGEFLSSL